MSTTPALADAGAVTETEPLFWTSIVARAPPTRTSSEAPPRLRPTSCTFRVSPTGATNPAKCCVTSGRPAISR